LSLVLAEGQGFKAPDVTDFWKPLPVFGDGAFAVTGPAIWLLVSVGLISWWLLAATRRQAVVPGRLQFWTEQAYGLVRNGLGRDILGSKDFRRYIPLLVTLFFLILVNNLFGVLPPVQFPTMSRIAFPVALTLIVFVLFHAIGIRRKGVAGYFKSLAPAGLGAGVLLLVYPLELVTYFFTRPVTLALRLFGNMFAGHLLLLLFVTGGEYLIFEKANLGLALAGGLSYVMAFVMTLFELLVEFLQAYIFTLLAALYIAGALADEH
jgi:F-type H+-transporting ATPase subunit a